MSPLSSTLVLAVESLVVAAIVLALFSARRRMGLGPLYAFVGATQYLQTVLAASLYVPFVGGTHVSPGSVVLFTSSLFAILLVYVREDVPATRSLIYGLVVANVSLTVLSAITHVQVAASGARNILGMPREVFEVNPRVFVVGTVTLVADAVLLIVIYEGIFARARRLPLFGRVLASLLLVVYFDSVVFSVGSFYGQPGLGAAIAGNLVGKTFSAGLFALVLWGYLRVGFGRETDAAEPRDPLGILTYRQRYEAVRTERDSLLRENELREQRDRLREEMTAAMVHDLRNPLAVLGVALSIITDALGKSSRRTADETLDLAKSATAQMLGLVNQILDLSRLESGDLPLEKTACEMRTLVEHVVAHGALAARARRVTLHVDIADGARVFGDVAMLRRVIQNLLDNAIKFAPDGGHVTIRARPGDKGTRVEVEDDGDGVPEDLRANLFQKFGRGRHPRSGSGLGLAFCRLAVEAHGGRIELAKDARSGAGATFRVELPAPP